MADRGTIKLSACTVLPNITDTSFPIAPGTLPLGSFPERSVNTCTGSPTIPDYMSFRFVAARDSACVEEKPGFEQAGVGDNAEVRLTAGSRVTVLYREQLAILSSARRGRSRCRTAPDGSALVVSVPAGLSGQFRIITQSSSGTCCTATKVTITP